MRSITLILLFLSITSCNYFNVEKTSSEAILKEELTYFTWDQVDAYPTFSTCDSTYTKTDKSMCFTSTLSTHLSLFLKEKHIVVTKTVIDTIKIDFQIDKTGIADIINIVVKPETLEQIPNTKIWLEESLKTLPKIYPAIKRDQPVKTQFSLPVIIATD